MKKKIAIITGGTSSEAEISILSASVVKEHIDDSRFDTYIMVIKGSIWEVIDGIKTYTVDKNDFSCTIENVKIKFDAVFLALHGSPAEDGKLQGYLDIMGIPYNSSGVLTSALSFNKQACKNYLQNSKVSMPRSIIIKNPNNINGQIEQVLADMSFPLFVKPNQHGSSIGIFKVKTVEDLKLAINEVKSIDSEFLIEEFIQGQELSCAVLRIDNQPVALPVTEILNSNEFFDFDSKYSGSCEEVTPAAISPELAKKCQDISIDIYKDLDCRGIIRVDFILRNGVFYLLEVNSIPGLSKHSIVPKQAEAFGLTLSQLFNYTLDDILSDEI